ncbi:hypothetical protein AMAG_19873 [Allomyces macrogynus ATCC 38327]|uniref:Uncharacterized protein n=1 Tax=Allomyces macrogynus (strain ATCC 38327) TaxID=578462 RepID=A0A0L0T2E0_ALLM3|nr:hypothetical protein AMAG_19873 [Allomyces macrogynus ATCC 38327]|eukprot:KNE68911.1 hypothetical protein AMAG_19873 [Allomyces macrogynus ATCC 38327]
MVPLLPTRPYAREKALCDCQLCTIQQIVDLSLPALSFTFTRVTICNHKCKNKEYLSVLLSMCNTHPNRIMIERIKEALDSLVPAHEHSHPGVNADTLQHALNWVDQEEHGASAIPPVPDNDVEMDNLHVDQHTPFILVAQVALPAQVVAPLVAHDQLLPDPMLNTDTLAQVERWKWIGEGVVAGWW